MKLIKNIEYSKHPECVLDIYLPDREDFNVFIYFHGGCLEGGSKADAKIMAEYLVAHNIAVISADYRMYPKAVYPEFIQDAASTVAWVKKHISEYGKCRGIYIGGSSAGGYISMMLCFDTSYLGHYKINLLDISGFIHDAGQPTCHFNVLRERGIDSRRLIVDEASPLFYVGMEKRYPKMAFIVSDNDMENRYEQTMLMLSTMKHFRYETPDLKIMNGKHCEYCSKIDDNDNSVLGKLIYKCIKKWSIKEF